MARSIYREQLDKMAQNGCTMPDCKHETHEPVIFLHSRCHTFAQAEASYSEEDQLHIVCGKCSRPIVDIAIKAAKGYKRCHVNAPLEISYRDGTGILKIQCHECKALLTELEVRSDGNKL